MSKVIPPFQGSIRSTIMKCVVHFALAHNGAVPSGRAIAKKLLPSNGIQLTEAQCRHHVNMLLREGHLCVDAATNTLFLPVEVEKAKMIYLYQLEKTHG